MNSLRLFTLIFFFLIQGSCKKEIMLIETGNISEVLTNTVHIKGYIDSAGEGIKKYGHCISSNPDPAITDIKTEFFSTIGTGEFTSVFYNLQPATKYYARGYISSGSTVVYGNEIFFFTR